MNLCHEKQFFLCNFIQNTGIKSYLQWRASARECFPIQPTNSLLCLSGVYLYYSSADTSTSDQFCHGKTWQYPQKSVDIATSKCFFFRGNNSVAREMTPNLRCKRDNVLYFVRCLSRRYIHAWSSLYPHLAVAVSMLCIRFFF